jgi:futalosine hydrolase
MQPFHSATPLLLIIPTLREGVAVLEGLGKFRQKTSSPFPIFEGVDPLSHIFLSYCGIGSAQAAMVTTACLSVLSVKRVLLLGVAGVLQDAGLQIGSLVFATEERYLRLGSGSMDSYDDLSDRFSLDPFKNLRSRFNLSSPSDGTLGIAGYRFGTSDWITSTADEIEFLRKVHPEVMVENMEGAAVAHVCAHFDLPLLEVRVIVNFLGDRDSKNWDWNSAMQAFRELGKIIREDRI